jgi:hypothetical protein
MFQQLREFFGASDFFAASRAGRHRPDASEWFKTKQYIAEQCLQQVGSNGDGEI